MQRAYRELAVTVMSPVGGFLVVVSLSNKSSWRLHAPHGLIVSQLQISPRITQLEYETSSRPMLPPICLLYESSVTFSLHHQRTHRDIVGLIQRDFRYCSEQHSTFVQTDTQAQSRSSSSCPRYHRIIIFSRTVTVNKRTATDNGL